MAFELDPSYKQVPERIADFKAKHPEGTLQSEIVVLPDAMADKFIAVKAYAYRTPEDPRPGVGLAYEPVPGKTPYTKDSELQNAETSAWGRAIVAALASESKSVASAEDVRNRQADAAVPDPLPVLASKDDIDALAARVNVLDDETSGVFVAWRNTQGYVWHPGYEVDAVVAMNAELDRLAPEVLMPLLTQESEPVPHAPSPDEHADPPRDLYDKAQKDDLVGACRLRSLAISGSKDDLLGRLRANDAEGFTVWCDTSGCSLAASMEFEGALYCWDHEPL